MLGGGTSDIQEIANHKNKKKGSLGAVPGMPGRLPRFACNSPASLIMLLMRFLEQTFAMTSSPPTDAYGSAPSPVHADALRSKEKGRDRHRYCHRSPGQKLAMITVSLKEDFARSEATWQSVSPLPKLLSTKG